MVKLVFDADVGRFRDGVERTAGGAGEAVDEHRLVVIVVDGNGNGGGGRGGQDGRGVSRAAFAAAGSPAASPGG